MCPPPGPYGDLNLQLLRHVTVGITGDSAANPDLDVLALGSEQSVSELLVPAKRHHRQAATKRRPAVTHR
jgi:hypothetical protein